MKPLLKERIKSAEELLKQIPAKYCFITGSFYTRKKYHDIDIFVISRSKREFVVNNEKSQDNSYRL